MRYCKNAFTVCNVTVLKNVQLTEITGSDKVDGLNYLNRETGEKQHINLQVFIQIGLVPNTDWLDGTLNETALVK